MCLDLAIHGDALERESVGVIREILPNYEEIWKKYIGNDGSASLFPFAVKNPEFDLKRIKVAQRLYTSLESFLCMRRVCELSVDYDRPDSLSAYIDQLNSFYAFQAHFGRIRDQLEQLGYLCGCDPSNLLDDGYSDRNVYVHGPKPPFSFTDYGLSLAMATPAEGSTGVAWHDKNTMWGSGNFCLKNISEYFEDKLKAVGPQLNVYFGQLLPGLSKMFAGQFFDKEVLGRFLNGKAELFPSVTPEFSPVRKNANISGYAGN